MSYFKGKGIRNLLYRKAVSYVNLNKGKEWEKSFNDLSYGSTIYKTIKYKCEW